MDYYVNVKALETKLAETLAKHNLLYQFKTEKYPLTLIIKQNQAPDAQMELYSTRDNNISSQDSVLRFIFKLDGIEIQTHSRLVMTDDLMNKIKGMGKKLRDAYCHAFFADSCNAERLGLYGRDNSSDDEDEDSDGTFDEFFEEDEEDPEEEE